MESNLFDPMGSRSPWVITAIQRNIGLAEKIFIFKKILYILTDIFLCPILFIFFDSSAVFIIMFIVTILVTYSFLVLSKYLGEDIFQAKKIKEKKPVKGGILVKIINYISKNKRIYLFTLFCLEPLIFTINIGDQTKNFGISNAKIFFLFIFSTFTASILSSGVGKMISLLF